MTRKDYVLIAAALNGACPDTRRLVREYNGWHVAVCALANALAADNPAFDRARFLKACGVQS